MSSYGLLLSLTTFKRDSLLKTMAPCLVIMTDTGGFSDGVSLLVNTVLSSPNAATNASFSHFLPVHSSSTAH